MVRPDRSGRVGSSQERAAACRGPGRRGRVCLRRTLRRAPPRAHHDVRRPRDRLHRHSDAARRPGADAAHTVHRGPRRHRRPRRAAGGGGRPGARARSRPTRPSSPSCTRPPSVSSPWSPPCSTTPASTTSASRAGPRASPVFAAKADRTVGGTPLYADPLTDITDQIGVRVITYLHSDVAAVADLLDDQLTVLDDRDMGEETASQGRFGYSSRHLLVATSEDARATIRADFASYDVLRGRRAQVQVRTVLQHAWAEFEHAIRYKGTIPAEHAPDLDRRFTLAAGLLELADREFTLIRDRLQDAVPDRGPDDADPGDPGDPRIDARDLATVPGEPVPRRRLVAHRPLRVGVGAAPRARRHLAERARRPAELRRHARPSTPGWATSTRPAPSAASTTRCSRSSPSATSRLHDNAHRVTLLAQPARQAERWRRRSG